MVLFLWSFMVLAKFYIFVLTFSFLFAPLSLFGEPWPTCTIDWRENWLEIFLEDRFVVSLKDFRIGIKEPSAH